jgi:hypothetical protein
MSLCELLGIDEPEIVIEEEEVKSKKLSPFDFTNSINYDKKDLFLENDDAEKQYDAFLVNKSLSFSSDTVLFANEMNMYPEIPAAMQFEFLKLIIRKKKRYNSWIKREEESEDISLLKSYYNYNNEDAEYAQTILLPEHISEIRKRMFTGGLLTKTKQKTSKNEK